MAGKGEPKLTEAARAFVVTALACFDAPSVVAEAVRKEFGIVITPQSIEGYDPTKRAGAKLAEKWKTLFQEARKQHTEATAEIGISHKTTRLRRLERLAERAEKQGNIALAASLLEQAAKEMGNAYTNTRVIQGGLALSTPKTLSDFYGGTDGS